MTTTAESTPEESHISESAVLEYQEAMNHHRVDSRLRRQGLAFASSFQIVAIAALSERVALSDIQVLMLSLLAFAVCLVSFNHDIRLSRYLGAYEKRILEIEGTKLQLMHIVINDVDNKRGFPFSNTRVFSIFYLTLSAGWGWLIFKNFPGWEALASELLGRA